MSRDPERELAAALRAAVAPDGRIVATRSRPWASGTFEGARHRLTLAMPAAAAADFAATLSGRPFGLPGHFVADILVTAVEVAGGVATLAIEALTIVDAGAGAGAAALGNEASAAHVAAA